MTGWALMENNIEDSDFENLIEWLKTKPKLTNGERVKQFEKEWSKWLGTEYSVFVNSGSSANYLSMIVLKELLKETNDKRNEILVCPMNWISDIASIMWAGFKPVFVDMNPKTLSIDNEKALEKITEHTAGIMLTHLCGFNALTEEFHSICKEKNIHIIEDVCESHAAIGYDGKKCGTYGEMSCFSYYYGHAATCVEGGMISTNSEKLYQILRMYRSHGLVRECTNSVFSKQFDTPGLEYNKGFVFAYPGFNMRNTEIGGVMGSFQLKKLDNNTLKRRKNFEIFLNNLNPEKYRTDFAIEGNANFALTTILQPKYKNNIKKICEFLQKNNFEYRKGLIGGNQLRQPYLKDYGNLLEYPETDYLHFYSVYIGNFPDLTEDRIKWLCKELNKI